MTNYKILPFRSTFNPFPTCPGKYLTNFDCAANGYFYFYCCLQQHHLQTLVAHHHLTSLPGLLAKGYADERVVFLARDINMMK